MATGKRGRGKAPSELSSAGASWRELGPVDRFAVLLNHYGSAEALSAATGIPARSLRAVFTSAVLQGKNSRVIESDAYREGFARARHSMTDALRRRVKSAKAGKFEAPIVRTPTNVIQPQRQQREMIQRDRFGNLKRVTAKSLWYSYNVEFLNDDEIYELLYTMFDTFMATGQFNTARYIFLSDADTYSGDEGFADRDYADDAERNRIISIGSRQFPFPEYRTPDEFAGDVMDDWATMQLRGGVRITKVYFASMQDIAQGDAMKYAQQEFNKRKKARGKNGKRKGKGRGI